jgi:hypothetical protein
MWWRKQKQKKKKMSLKHHVFINDLKQYLKSLEFTDIISDDDMSGISISFHNPNYDFNSTLINQFAPEISNFIDKKGFDSDDFIIYGSIIEFPKDFEDK